MKNLFKQFMAPAFIFLFITSCSNQVDDNSTIEKLGETVLSAVASSDANLLDKHLCDAEDIEWLKKYAYEFKPSEEKSLTRLANGYRENPLGILTTLQQEFAQNGVNDWSDVQLDNVKYSLGKKPSFDRTITTANNIIVTFKNAEHTGIFVLRSAYLGDDGWVLTSLPKFHHYR